MPVVPSSKTTVVPSGIVPLYLNATFPKYIRPSGLLLYHGVPEKALEPMVVTLLGIVTFIRLLQLLKALLEILMTPSVKIKFFRLLLPWNQVPISCIPIVKVVMLLHP